MHDELGNPIGTRHGRWPGFLAPCARRPQVQQQALACRCVGALCAGASITLKSATAEQLETLCLRRKIFTKAAAKAASQSPSSSGSEEATQPHRPLGIGDEYADVMRRLAKYRALPNAIGDHVIEDYKQLAAVAYPNASGT